MNKLAAIQKEPLTHEKGKKELLTYEKDKEN